MTAKTKLLLYELYWLGDQITCPTFRNLSNSFEAWAYSKGLLQTIFRLQDEEILETQGKSLERVIQLTDKGRQLVHGNREPEAEWMREWNQSWKMVIFDIPESQRLLREQLRKFLRSQHFGCFQQSVWLSPHPMDSINASIREVAPDLSSLTLMECRLLPGENDADVVNTAWDFSAINTHYEDYIKHLDSFENQLNSINTDHYLSLESSLWEKALKHDPLLPTSLLPKGYLGKKAYRLRCKKMPKLISNILKKHK
ncbi:MAG: hypothetical protein L3J39_04460 [Verrucomicrobiales bacterium]|nr:hypothetical protein [Verrucomicrobiales bacterium]